MLLDIEMPFSVKLIHWRQNDIVRAWLVCKAEDFLTDLELRAYERIYSPLLF